MFKLNSIVLLKCLCCFNFIYLLDRVIIIFSFFIYFQKLTKELATEKKNVKDVQKTLEEEILQRVTAENKLQSLRENFKFKEEVKGVMHISINFP